MKKIKVGLTGLGRIGKAHLDNLVYRLPEAQIVAVSDINPETKKLAGDYGIRHFYRDFREVLALPEIEAVIICSPTPTHLEYIKLAAEAGKHIFCEKPLEMTIEKIKIIQKIIQKAKVKLQVGFNRRFDADFIEIKRTVENGHIGDPHILKITSRDPGPPPLEYIRLSGGLFLDMTIHDFDMARFIVGSEVTEVYAQGAVRVDKQIGKADDIDTAIVQLTFANGVLAAIDNSRKATYGYDQRLEIFGSKGMSCNTNHRPNSHSLFNEKGGLRPPALHFFMERYADSYRMEMQSFIQAIQEDKTVPVDANDALMATKIALAAQKSVKEHRPVQLNDLP